ncbi:transketolase [Acuticoccus sediminis]|uniref:Transketolase n=1 Tax=Acuticoccus sediminis TaxID=2184697 RepID=A0A8B2NU46_9HYPH|nr:transketolase C-terminal domain-containing protein [Acuticoccus sediminis]RAI00805.1 transketolase [Acuticoccus sediminis]
MTTEMQNEAEIFRGTTLGETRLKDRRSVRGTPKTGMPAFVLGEELAALADTDPRIVVATADLASANRTNDFRARHPDRFFNFGIAERNMITAAAGMASSGLVPFVATFASFAAILGAEQIKTDCAYPRQKVRVVGTHSGMSMGFYGSSHHSLEDLGMMRAVADLTVACATDADHLRGLLRIAVDQPGAMYIRLGRGRDPKVYDAVPDLAFGRAVTLREGRDLTILATGSTVRASLDAAEALAADGVTVRVVDMWTIAPLDVAAIEAAAGETGAILTVEEHNLTGGLGSAVAEVLVDLPRIPFKRHGVPDRFVEVGPPAALYAHYQLDAPGIAGVARELLARKG